MTPAERSGAASTSPPASSSALVVRRSTRVQAPPSRVWELVSDLPGMGRFSPESTGGRWVGGAEGPAVGARFRGTNAAGRRRWSTSSTVTRCEPGRAFAFAVAAAGLPVAVWSYELEPDDGGCRVTETWEDRRGRLMGLVGRLTTGVQDREAFAAKSMEHTLERLRATAEAG